jgi:inhibitor of cysteine peptidase
MKAGLLIMVVVLASFAVSGCSATENRPHSTTTTTSTTQTPTIEASDSDNRKDITIAVGDTLRLTLTANHSIPFRWAVDTKIGDTTVLQQTGHEYVASSTTTGGPSSEYWTFKALKAGTTTITNEETPISNAGQAPLNTFTAKVIVK